MENSSKFNACHTNTKLLFHRVHAYFSRSFLTQNELSTADRIHECVYCLICTEICMSSRSGKEGKIIGNLIQSRDKIVSKLSRPTLEPTSLYKVAQWPWREDVYSPPPSSTISSWPGAQRVTAQLYLYYIGFRNPVPSNIFHIVTAGEVVHFC